LLVGAHSAQAGDPCKLAFCLCAEERDDFRRVVAEFHGCLQMVQCLVSGSQRVFPQAQNPFAIFRDQHSEKTDADAEGIFRSRILIAEFTNAIDQRPAAESSNGILLTVLSSLAGNDLPGHPLVGHEAPEQRINEVVVQLALSEDDAGILLEPIAVLRTSQQHAQDY